jgi:hypothetical protein
MIRFWLRQGGCFLPVNPFKIDFYRFLITVPVTVFTAILELSMEKTRSIIIVCALSVLFVTGMVRLVHDKKIKLIILICVPILLHLLLSAFQLYPFYRRLILYTLPGVIMACALGFDYFAKAGISLLKHKNIRRFVVIIPILFSSFFLFSRFPAKFSENKESIKYIKEYIHESKNVYLYGSGSIIIKYYNDIRFLPDEINIINEEAMDNREKAMDLLDPVSFENCINELILLCHKNWILFPWTIDDEKLIVVSALDSLGYDRVKEFHTKGSSVYLYDFGE